MTDLREFSGETLEEDSPQLLVAVPCLLLAVLLLLLLALSLLDETSELILVLKESGNTFSRDVSSERIFDFGSGFLWANAEWLVGNCC